MDTFLLYPLIFSHREPFIERYAQYSHHSILLGKVNINLPAITETDVNITSSKNIESHLQHVTF